MLNWVRSLPIIRNHLAVRQLIKFTLAGIIFALIDFAIYIFLTRIFIFWETHWLWANFLSIAASATGNFFLNKKWTFADRTKRVLVQYIKFWVVVVIGILVYQYLFWFFVEKINLYDLLGKIITAILVMFIRFFLNKKWTFAVKG